MKTLKTLLLGLTCAGLLAGCSKSAPEIEPLSYLDHPLPSQFTLEDPSRFEKPVDRWVITPHAEYEITAIKLGSNHGNSMCF